MKTDIVDRLKEAATTEDMGRPKDARTLYRQAAREIEELRKALMPMTRGTYWINAVDVKRAKKALHLDDA